MPYSDLDLRRLAERYRIKFFRQQLSSRWPAAHRQTFQNIQNIGLQPFESFCPAIDIHSGDQPWKGALKRRAEWLAENAARLFKQKRNEADWRLHLEATVFRRLTVEIACPKCRARIWRSEIEVSFDQHDRIIEDLAQQRKNRAMCQCPAADRVHDFYEMGINPLFDDRIQREIQDDPTYPAPPHVYTPKQQPDRIYGLQQTENFKKLLLQPLAADSTNSPATTLGDTIRVSPFKEEHDPLIFPFLVLEAKSEDSKGGFDAVQTQTAFPIFALLNLQHKLRKRVKASRTNLSPFIWFLANRGDSWRVYGCYITDSNPIEYHIVHMWDGSVSSHDRALQLLLIVDYIFDWARDLYRPSILRQLKSIATDKDYDTVSLTRETNIFSSYNRISDWVPGAPTYVDGLDLELDKLRQAPTMDYRILSAVDSSQSKLVLRRSALVKRTRVVGLWLSTQNIEAFLKYARTDSQDDSSVNAAAEILRFMAAHVSESVIFEADDLRGWEQWWSNDETTTAPSARLPYISQGEEFLVVFSFATFINDSWDIVHESTYLAVSRDVLLILNTHANILLNVKEMAAIDWAHRSWSPGDIHDARLCLGVFSPEQLLMAAISCTCFSPFSRIEQEQRCTADSSAAGAFDAGTLRRSLLRNLVQKYHKLRPPREAPPNFDPTIRPMSPGVTYIKPGPRDPNESFIRVFESIDNSTEIEGAHIPQDCEMCNKSERQKERKENDEEFVPWANPWADQVRLSDRGMVLVESLSLKNQLIERQDSCVYTLKDTEEFEDPETLDLIVKDLRQSGKVYHTFLHAH